MNNQSITGGQMRMWVLASVSAGLAHFSGCGWLTALLLVTAILPLTGLPGAGWQNLGEFWCAAEFVWLTVAAGVLLRSSGAYWPSAEQWFVPVALLALAAWNAGSEKGARVGSALGWILMGLFGIVLLVGLAQIEPEWEKPAVAAWEPALAAVLLIPALKGIWIKENTVSIGPGIAAVLFGLLTQGILSRNVSAYADAPMYETAESLTAGGVCWELPVAAAMTLGWYALAALLAEGAAEMAAKCAMPKKWGAAIFFAGATVVVFVNFELSTLLFPGICLILWVIVPYWKKNKKVEKRD